MPTSLSQTTPGSSRRTLLRLAAIAVVALALPTLKWGAHTHSAGPGVVVGDDAAQPAGGGAATDRREKSPADSFWQVAAPEFDYLPRPSKFEEQVLAALEKPLDVEFSRLALQDCIDYLWKESKIPMYIDRQNLTDEGIELDQPITLKLKSTRLESVLNLLLHPVELAYFPENEVLKITIMSKASEKMITRTYPVRDLVMVPKLPDDESTSQRPEVPASSGAQKGPTPSNANPTEKKRSTGAANQVLKQGFGGGGRSGGMSPSVGASVLPGYGPGYMDFLGLMNLITTTIQPDSWEDLSGPGSVMPYRTSGSLVIRQTWDVHREVLQLLRDLREAKRLAKNSKKENRHD